MQHELVAWMRDRAEQELMPFCQEGITAEQIHQIWQSTDVRDSLLVRLTIAQGHIRCTANVPRGDRVRVTGLLQALDRLRQNRPLPDVEMLFSMHDGYTTRHPICVFAKHRATSGILIPDFEALMGHQPLAAEILAANRHSPWKTKIPQAIWRGSSTGGLFTLDNWQGFPRSQLVQISQQFPGHLDARFSRLSQMEPSTLDRLRTQGLVDEWLSPQEQLRFKYLVEIDGNSCPYSHTVWSLLANSLLLKQSTDQVQWYYGVLQPYEHFLPLKADLSDIITQIEWARDHDDHCQAMAQQATQFALQHLSPSAVDAYLRIVIERYADYFFR